MGTEADYLIDQNFDRERGEYGDEKPPTPDTLDHFVEEVSKAHTPDDALERQKWQEELAHDAFDHFKRAEILNEMRIKNYIEQWKPRGE